MRGTSLCQVQTYSLQPGLVAGLRVLWGRRAEKQMKAVWHDTCHDRARNRILMRAEVFFFITDHQMVAWAWMPLILSVLANSAWKKHFFKSVVGMCRLVSFSCENLNYWIFLKIQKLWHPWAHTSIWQWFGGWMMEAPFRWGRCSPAHSLSAPQHRGCCWPPLTIKLPALFPCHKVTRELKYFLYPTPSKLEQWKIHWEGTMLQAKKGGSQFLCRYETHS